jgi:hypothetical protein
MRQTAVRPSALVLFVLLAIGIGKTTAQPVVGVHDALAQRSLANDPGGNDPTPPPPCCNVVAVH